MLKQQIEREFIVTRINLVTAIVILVFLIYVTGFWYLQVVKGPHYAMLAGENVFKDYPVPAPRGLILDRNNQILAENRLSHNLFLTPRLSRNLKNTFTFLSNVLLTTPEDLRKTLQKEGSIEAMRPVLIYQDLSLAQLAYISARKIEYPELEIKHEQKRLYSYDFLFSHALGYVGEITEEQERDKVFPGAVKRDIVGQYGLERFYNSLLMGKTGYEKKVVNSYGAVLKDFPPKIEPPKPGSIVRLGLDLNIQNAIHEAFIESDKYGSVAAIDIKTGEVMALYSRPYFNPNDFIPRISPSIWKELLSDPMHPLTNRAIQNKFSPGSTFKIVMALAALQEGKITPSTRFGCGGAQFIYNRTFRCWKPGGHGSVDLYRAIMQSCDVYFYNVGMRMDIDVIAKYSRMFGLGSLTGVDLPNESKGLVPDRAWKRQVAGDKWYPGETISVAIGQGPILVTALQMASLLAAVASDGTYTQPHLLSAILDRNGKVESTPKFAVHHVQGIDRNWYELVKRALWGVVNDAGTGGRTRIEGYDICGKTGTVQVVGYDKGKGLSETQKHKYGDHAWFVAFAPFTDPQLALAIFVQHGGHGSDAAAPVAKKVFERYFRDRKIAPYPAPEWAPPRRANVVSLADPPPEPPPVQPAVKKETPASPAPTEETTPTTPAATTAGQNR